MKQTKVKNKFPLEHLSASCITLLESDEEKWIDKYLKGEKQFETKHMKYGRLLADMFDEDIFISCNLKRGKDKVKLVGYLDGYNKRSVTQYENKTSTTAWTQAKCNKLLQLKIYALIHYKNNKKIPKQELTWYKTKMVDGELELTGEQGTFKVNQTMVDLLECEVRVWKAYDRICELSEIELNKI